MKNPFTAVRVFWNETLSELRKVAWPTRKELKESTIVVVIGIALLGAYITVVDFSLFQVVSLFTSWARFGIGG